MRSITPCTGLQSSTRGTGRTQRESPTFDCKRFVQILIPGTGGTWREQPRRVRLDHHSTRSIMSTGDTRAMRSRTTTIMDPGMAGSLKGGEALRGGLHLRPHLVDNNCWNFLKINPTCFCRFRRLATPCQPKTSPLPSALHWGGRVRGGGGGRPPCLQELQGDNQEWGGRHS